MKGKIITTSGYALLVKLDNIFKHNNMSNADHVIQDLHDILQSYYKAARKRMVDNLCIQAADFYLLTGPDTPLNVLSPEFIRRLTAEDLVEALMRMPMSSIRGQSCARQLRIWKPGRRYCISIEIERSSRYVN